MWDRTGTVLYRAVLRIRDVYPETLIRILPSRIQCLQDSGSATKNLCTFNPKNCFQAKKHDFKIFFPDPDPEFFPSRIQGPKKRRIRNTDIEISRMNNAISSYPFLLSDLSKHKFSINFHTGTMFCYVPLLGYYRGFE
jgi:hypothetical protein